MKYYKKIDEFRRPLKIIVAIVIAITLVLLIVGTVKFLERKKVDNRDDISAPTVTNGVVTDWGNAIDIVIKNRYIGGKVPTTKIDISKMSYTARQPNPYTETVKLPASIEEIAEDSFDFFMSLKSIKVSIFNKHFKSVDGILYSKDGKTLIRYPVGKEGESFAIPDGVETIAYNAFYGNKNLKSVKISDSVKIIAEGAFRECTSLDNVVIPDSVTSIGDNAFSKCESLKSITLSQNLQSIGAQAFSDCITIESIVLPDSLKNFGVELFLGCWKLYDVTFPNGIEEIPDGMLSCCNSLTSFVVPSSVKRIGIAAFDGAGLIEITLNEGLETIAWRAFEDCNYLRQIVLPKSVQLIDSEAFQNSQRLESVTFLGGDVRVGGGAFDGCDSIKYVNAQSIENWLSLTFENRGANPLEFGARLNINKELVTDIVIPEGSATIGAYQFSGYKYLESVILPEGLEMICNSAFENCKKLNEITLVSSLKSIENSAFSGCISLKDLYIPSLEFYIDLGDYGSVLSNVENLYIDGERISEIALPEGIERINDFAFCNWRFLESIYIPSTVENIGYGGLAGCTSLTQIRFGGTIAEWEQILEWSPYWKQDSDNYTVICVDGEIEY